MPTSLSVSAALGLVEYDEERTDRLSSLLSAATTLADVPTVSGPEPGGAFGAYLLDRLAGAQTDLFYERDDGFVSGDPVDYFDAWTERDQWALDRVTGRVLDVGAGAGRATLAVQERGQPVLALDTSAGAIEVCRHRGVLDTFHGTLDDLAAQDGQRFDHFLFVGNTLGLMGSPDNVAGFFATIERLSSPGAVIVGGGLDPYQTDIPDHLTYHRHNQERGRYAGQIRLRTRYRRLTSDWFDLLWLSIDELTEISSRSGWRVADALEGANYSVALTRS